jgi:hypothetical protein
MDTTTLLIIIIIVLIVSVAAGTAGDAGSRADLRRNAQPACPSAALAWGYKFKTEFDLFYWVTLLARLSGDWPLAGRHARRDGTA